jgi:phosphatidate cytidylyltransferase
MNILLTIIAALFALGALLIAAEHRAHHVGRRRRRSDWIKFTVFLPLVLSLVLAAHHGRPVFGIILGLIALGGSVEIYRNLHNGFRPWAAILSFVLFLCALSHLLIASSLAWVLSVSLAVMFTASMDAFSQLWGRLLGRRRLCPRLSPGKTVEGSAGGLLTTLALALALGCWLPRMILPRLAALALLTALAGLAGDLTFSAVKRRLGVKDFSGLLPGHGGVLDRFDSLIVAAPAYYWGWVWLMG